MLEAGLFYEKLQHLLSISPKRIAIIKKGLSIDHRMGRPPKITQPMLDYTEMLSLTNARLTDRHITSLVNEKFSTNVSKTTIARIRRKLGFIYRPPLAKQELNELQKQMRLEFCNWVLQNRSHVNNIVFSDESRFEKGPDNTWRRIKREIWNDSCFCEKQKFIPGIMVWGAIGQGFRTPFMRSSGSVNAEEKVDTSTLSMWTKYEDDRVFTLQSEIKNKWKIIGKCIGKDPTQVKNRFNFLKTRINNDRLKSIVSLPSIEELPFDYQSVFGSWNPDNCLIGQ